METPDFRETLYTIDRKGARHWVYPSIVRGSIYHSRSIVAMLLLGIYLVTPWIEVGGKQAVFLDIIGRKFIFFGNTFWATDGRMLWLVLAGLGLSLFFFTALVGRAWCGWACPETVFLEFIFRPIETIIEGSPSQRKRLDAQPWTSRKILRKFLKYSVFSFLAWFISSTFLAYFVGAHRLLEMMSNSPTDNLGTFLSTLLLMGILLFQFGWFREQFCTVLCPYARFQSVLMDPHSILVGYDARRGEPRGKLIKSPSKQTKGDCIDCGLCVRVCPTGIDIRNGTQLECIHCAQCIDACNSIMTEINKPQGLIRYDTESVFRGGTRTILRPRIVGYAFAGLLYFGLAWHFTNTYQRTDIQFIRTTTNAAFTELADGRISNQFKAHISNKSDEATAYEVDAIDATEVEVITPLRPFTVQGGSEGTLPIFTNFPKSILKSGKAEARLRAKNNQGFVYEQSVTLLGPE